MSKDTQMPLPPKAGEGAVAAKAPKATKKAAEKTAAPAKTKKVEGMINVVATRAGYYGHQRRAEGDKFQIPAGEKPGSWMQVI
jgi:hypothetical protein